MAATWKCKEDEYWTQRCLSVTPEFLQWCLSGIPELLQRCLSGTPELLQSTTKAKYLGVVIDCSLDWREQIQSILARFLGQ